MNDQIMPFNYLSGRDTFSRIRQHTWNMFLAHSHRVHTEEWQGVDISKRPEMVSHELMNYTFTHRLNGVEDLQFYRNDIQPNLPWADDHFEERVCGEPINPGVEWANWPWAQSADTFRSGSWEHGLEPGQFNHNYMERYWPKHAGQTPDGSYQSRTPSRPWQDANWGIRNEYGDLNDLVQQLAARPLSRQEWFPIFHPEDVGEVVGGRKPCSLGYQFWVRGGQLHVYYPLRSCDFFRHMPDDIYLTIRLLLWVLDQCRIIYDGSQDHEGGIPNWHEVTPGTFTMHCTSLHVFANDMVQMRKEGPK